MSITQIFMMDGYGPYVWSAYSITIIVFSLNLFFTLSEKKQIKKIISQYLTDQHES